MATAHSNRKRSTHRAVDQLPGVAPATPADSAKKPSRITASARRRSQDDLLGQLSEALSILETAHRALEAAREAHTICHLIGAEVATLEFGIAHLRAALYDVDHVVPCRAEVSNANR